MVISAACPWREIASTALCYVKWYRVKSRDREGKMARWMVVIAALILVPVLAPLAAHADDAKAALDASSHATKAGDDETLDNTSFSFASCGSTQSGERLLLRLRIQIKSNLQDVGVEGHVQLDAFPAAGPYATPIYSVAEEGADARLEPTYCLLFVDRGLEEFSWWDVRSLRSGKSVFETDEEPLLFSLLSDDDTSDTYVAGFYVPPDDEKRKSLAQPDIAGVVAVSREDALLGRLLVRADDKDRAARLRSFADERRYLAIVDAKSGAVVGKASGEKPLSKRPLALEIYWADANLRLRIPLTKQGLDREHATLPKGLRLELWNGQDK